MISSPAISDFQGKITESIAQSDVDAIIVCSRQNLRHLTNLYLPHLRIVPEEFVFAIWTKSGERSLVVPGWLAEAASQKSDIPTTVWPFGGKPWPTLGRQIRAMGLEGARIGIELETMTVATLHHLKELLPEAAFVGIDALQIANRQVKTKDEIAVISDVASAGERAMMEAIERGKVGMTDREFARELSMASLRQGAEEIAWLALSWGTADQRTDFTDKPIQPGQIFSIEFGLSIDGYYSDLQRSVAVAPVADDVADAYQNLVAVHKRTVERMQPGRTVAAVHSDFMDDMKANGLQMWDWWLGHSLGLDCHEGESLWLRDGEPTELREGMVFAVEPVITTPALLAIEDVVVVEAEKAKALSHLHNWDSIAILGQPVG